MMSTKRQRTTEGFAQSDAQEGATEVGHGLEVVIPRSIPHGYNNNYTVDLTYADNYRSDSYVTSAGYAQQIFRVNSIQDPDYSGTGHQPYFRDLWASMYDYYTVLSCDYTIRMFNASGQDPITFSAAGTSAQTIGSVNVSLMPSTNIADFTAAGSSSGLIYPAAEMKNTVTKFLCPQKQLEFSGTLTPGDFIVDAKDSDDDTTWTAVGSNPAVPRYLGYTISNAQWTSLTGSVETAYASIQVQVILRYTVQFTQVNPTLRS